MAGTSDAGAAFAEGMGRRLDEREAEAVRGWLARAPAGCPAARVALADFAAHTGAKLAGAGEDLAHALGTLRPGDLYLAFAIARQDPAAIAELERRLGDVDVVLRAANLGELTDEIRQHMRVSLVLPRAAGPPVILDYAGRGDLGAWLRTIALRAAWKLAERARRDTADDEDALLALPAPGDDAETEVLKSRYAPEFKQALHDALAAMAPRERTLLRQAFLDGLSVDQLGRLHGVHRATAARWLAVARADLLEQTVKRLQARLGVGRADLDSLWRLVRSRLDISQL